MDVAAVERTAWAAVDWMVAAEPEGVGLYHGEAGVLLALHEAAAHADDAGWAARVEERATRLASADPGPDSSLYFGATGVAVALGALGRTSDAERLLARVRDQQDEHGRWGPMFELLAGNAGIALGARAVGDLELAVAALTPYVATATPTAGGVNWPVRPTPARSHHVAHGTLGIVLALAAVGYDADRPDLVELALAGAADVVGRDMAGPEGFLVPHSDPPHRPDLVERWSLGWCNGPAGDAQVFRLLGRVTGDEQWARLADRCWHTVTTSGLPRRLRPGFWDNQGRCCGTAGVLALALDREVERGDPPGFADSLVADLLDRVTVDDPADPTSVAGARWSNHEHRAEPPETRDLPPRPGWAMGSAGIVRELLRHARLRAGRDPSYAVPWPDHPVTA